MDREGSSRHFDIPPPPPGPKPVVEGDTYARDQKEALDEEKRAEASGEKVFPPQLWNRLKNPPPGRSTIDLFELKQDGEVLTMTFVCDGEKFPMYFTPRSSADYVMRSGVWTPRANQMYKSLRTRLFSLPKTMTINKVMVHSTPQCEVEDCVIELMFVKKWQCKQLEYSITCEFSQPQHLRKMIHMLKPYDITVTLNFGLPQSNQSHDSAGQHNHLAVDLDGTLFLEKDFRMDCQIALNNLPADSNKREINMLYTDAGKGKLFATQVHRTLLAIRKFVTMMTEKQMAQTKGMDVKKFVVQCPAYWRNPINDKICPKLLAMLKDDGPEEAAKKKHDYSQGNKLFVCVRNELRRQNKLMLSMAATMFKMNLGNEQLLLITKQIPNLQVYFKTTVDEHAIQQMVGPRPRPINKPSSEPTANHTNLANKVSWAHPKFGNLFATVAYSKKVSLWQEQHGHWQKYYEWNVHEGSANCVAFGPPEIGLKLASGTANGDIGLLRYDDVRKEWLSTKIPKAHKQCVNSVCWAPWSEAEGAKQRLLSVGSDQTVKIWTVDSASTMELEGTMRGFEHASWSPANDNAFVAVGPNGQHAVFRIDEWQYHVLERETPQPHLTVLEKVKQGNLQKKMIAILKIIKELKDEADNEIVIPFTTLPSREELPEYYQTIQKPMDFDRIEKKIETGRYTKMEELNNDMLLLCANAQMFNEEESDIYQDSLTIEKTWKAEYEKLMNPLEPDSSRKRKCEIM